MPTLGIAGIDIHVDASGAEALLAAVHSPAETALAAAKAYGIRARSYIEQRQQEWDAGRIFIFKDKAGGRAYIAERETARKGRGKNRRTETRMNILYILMRRVFQPQDPSRLPDEGSIMDEFAKGAAMHFRELARKAAPAQ